MLELMEEKLLLMENIKDILKSKESITAKYLNSEKKIVYPKNRKKVKS